MPKPLRQDSKSTFPPKYLTVGETARILGVSPSTLRLWENEGLISPARSGGRYRLYSHEVLGVLKRIYATSKNWECRASRRCSTAGRRWIVPPAPQEPAIGPRLRKMRKSLNLGIAEAANCAGISPGFLSAIELSKANASIATLHRLAATYNSTVLEFFDLPTQSRRLLRPGQEESYGLTPEWISSCSRSATRCSNRCCSGFLPRPVTESYSHVGEEFIYMLKGTLEIWLGELERHLLRPGDSFWFESNVGHRWFNPSDEDALLLWINTPPTF